MIQVTRFVGGATTVSCNTAPGCAARRLITALSLRCNAWVQALLGERVARLAGMRCAQSSLSIRPKRLPAPALSLSGQPGVEILLASVLPAASPHTTLEFSSPSLYTGPRKLTQASTAYSAPFAALWSTRNFTASRPPHPLQNTFPADPRSLCAPHRSKYVGSDKKTKRWRPPPSRST